MIDSLLNLLGYDFVQNAIAAGLVIALVSGIVSRFVVEQWITFPRFVLSGAWAQNLRRVRRVA